MKLKDNQRMLIAMVIFLTLFVSGKYLFFLNKLKHNCYICYIVKKAVVDKVYPEYRTGVIIEYHFVFNGEQINNSYSIHCPNDELREQLVKKTFPVAVNKNDADESQILLFQSDFEKYNLQFPDSMNWVNSVCN